MVLWKKKIQDVAKGKKELLVTPLDLRCHPFTLFNRSSIFWKAQVSQDHAAPGFRPPSHLFGPIVPPDPGSTGQPVASVPPEATETESLGSVSPSNCSCRTRRPRRGRGGKTSGSSQVGVRIGSDVFFSARDDVEVICQGASTRGNWELCGWDRQLT